MKESKENYINIMKNFSKMVLRTTGEIYNYPSWSDGFAREEINGVYQKLNDAMKGIDYTQFTKDELINIFGFGKWDDNLVLIPIYLISKSENGVTVSSINGEKITVNESKKLDADNRFGMTAYGFTKDQLR